MVVNTVLTVFPRCRMFREEAAPVSEVQEKDFTNMIMFCRKSNAPFWFREPVTADVLGSQARRVILFPEHEVQAEYFNRTLKIRGSHILRRGQTRQLAALQQRSALDHWHIMRAVIPGYVWEKW